MIHLLLISYLSSLFHLMFTEPPHRLPPCFSFKTAVREWMNYYKVSSNIALFFSLQCIPLWTVQTPLESHCWLIGPCLNSFRKAQLTRIKNQESWLGVPSRRRSADSVWASLTQTLRKSMFFFFPLCLAGRDTMMKTSTVLFYIKHLFVCTLWTKHMDCVVCLPSKNMSASVIKQKNK